MKYLRFLLLGILLFVATPAWANVATELDQAPLQPEWTGNKAVDQELKNVINQVAPAHLSTSERVSNIYDYLIDSIAYTGLEKLPQGYQVRQAPDAQKGIGPRPYYGYDVPQALFTRTGTCEEYTLAFVQLTRAIGLDTIAWSGKVRNLDGSEYIHVWPLMKLNGKIYIFDPTIDDNASLYRGGHPHDYFGMTLEASKGTFFVFDDAGYYYPLTTQEKAMEALFKKARTKIMVTPWENSPDMNTRIKLIKTYANQKGPGKETRPEPPSAPQVQPPVNTPAPEGISVHVDNQKLIFDVPPFIDSGRTLVPIRAIAEALGCEVEWQGDSRTATISKLNDTIRMRADELIYDNKGQPTLLDVPLQIKDGRIVVPVRVISESFEASVSWDNVAQLVNIESA